MNAMLIARAQRGGMPCPSSTQTWRTSKGCVGFGRDRERHTCVSFRGRTRGRVASKDEMELTEWQQNETFQDGVEALRIRGGRQLHGEVQVSGSKNAVLALLAASLLSDKKIRMHNVPIELTDVDNMIEVLLSLGVKCVRDRQNSRLELDCSSFSTSKPDPAHVRALRASFLVTGPLLARLGEAVVALPGGCKIGTRPVNLHIEALQKLGADIIVKDEEYIVAKAKALIGCKIDLAYPSVGATETTMMAAAFAEGETCITNAAMEPEIEELGNFLNSIGIPVEGAGSSVIKIKGVELSSIREVEHQVIPDRIEAGTFLTCGAITYSELSLHPVEPRHLTAILDTLQQIGCQVIQEDSDRLTILPSRTSLTSLDIVTSPYPGFPTDMQPLLTSLLTCCSGTSIMKETIFENRMNHVGELVTMGADIKLENDLAIVKGFPKNGTGTMSNLMGRHVYATDLRAGVALVIAGLVADGETFVSPLYHIDRGYVSLDKKLEHIGADVRRVLLS